jgi:hypothetical protein
VLAFMIFLLQQWSGQNSVSYYAPQIFASIGYSSTTTSLLASGVYGVVKVVSTAIFVFFFVETLGRKRSLFISAIGMGVLFFIVGAILKTHPPPKNPPEGASPPPASQAMAAMLYIYVCFYSMGWGPLPWVYVSDIFPTRTRHYGLAVASGSQWLWNFVVSKVTPTLEADLGYKLFFMFATINIGGMAIFSLLIPETKVRARSGLVYPLSLTRSAGQVARGDGHSLRLRVRRPARSGRAQARARLRRLTVCSLRP